MDIRNNTLDEENPDLGTQIHTAGVPDLDLLTL
jgi:hypothetical protein